MKTDPIYVERLIQSSFKKVWEYTQEPSKHQQWDMRFSEIVYLPKSSADSAQQFRYTTKIGFGIKASGKGESSGIKKENDESTSSLKFWSDEPISIIEAGSGYWKYCPQGNGVKFLTWYDYKTRFGFLGRVIDRLVFRPLLGWATALSFDCLGLWLEKNIHPKVSFERFFIQWIGRWALALIWIYQGLIPKLIFKDSGELEILRSTGIFPGYEAFVMTWMGLGEIALGVSMLMLKRSRCIYYFQIIALMLLLFGAFFGQPKIIIQPFNPVSLTLGMTALAVVGLKTLRDLPSAGHCLRKKAG